jgi:hypothetical protein
MALALGCFFNFLFLVVFCAFAFLLAHLLALAPLPEWLKEGVLLIQSFSGGLLVLAVAIKSVFQSRRWRELLREPDVRFFFLLWVVTAIACGVAIGIHLLLARSEMDPLAEQMLVSVGAFAFWFLTLHLLAKRFIRASRP